jgi:hypothetical protein
MPGKWPVGSRVTYLVASIAFRRIYAAHGATADSVRREKMGLVTRILLKAAIQVYRFFHRRRTLDLKVRVFKGSSAAGQWAERDKPFHPN